MGSPGVQAQAHLGRYELLARLATGGMGEIFLARLEGAAGFEKLYVVKRILPHLADDARFRQMLIAEARIASKMSHANICQVYELGETDGQLYIVMEYLEGITLLPLLRKCSKAQTPLDLGFVAGIVQQTCDALHYAHELKDREGESLGIVHRDVTPSNVFLTDSGIAKVLDFGIAKARGAQANTQTGAVKGKYAYMAPEQLKGAGIDHRVDIFALGVVVYEMLALRRLFQRKTDYLTFRAVMEQPIPDIRKYRPDIPEKLAEVLGRALERDPANRPETARQFGTAVIDALEGKRPWTQGELGDFVRANFADEISKRSREVSHVINRSGSGSARSTMPMIIPETSDAGEGDDEDDEFASVESAVEDAPETEVPVVLPPRPAGDFGGNTPPPFGTDPSGLSPGLQSLHSLPAQIVVAQPRSLVWPMLAVAMVVIAGGALFLVWRQMQERQPEVKIYTEQTGASHDPPVVQVVKAVEPAGSASEPPDGSDHEVVDPKGSADQKGTGAAVRHPVKHLTYDGAIATKQAVVQQCLRDHYDDTVTTLHALVTIAPSGKAKNVVFTPATYNGTPLGMCIHNALMSVAFPSSPEEQKIDVPYFAKNRSAPH